MTADSNSQESTEAETRPTPAWLEAAHRDLEVALEHRLHWITLGVIGGVLLVTAVGLAGLSWAFYTTGDLPGFVDLLTVNSAWFYTSIFALVGLFIGYAGMETGERFDGWSAMVGLVMSRWSLVAAAVAVTFLVLAPITILTYDPFSITAFVAFAVLTAVLLMAFVSAGVGIRLASPTSDRAVFGALVLYVVLVYCWDTTIAPMLVVLPLSGDPQAAIGSPPGWAEYLFALSPGRAYAVLADWALAGGLGGLELLATLVLLTWLIAPVVGGGILARRRYERQGRL